MGRVDRRRVVALIAGAGLSVTLVTLWIVFGTPSFLRRTPSTGVSDFANAMGASRTIAPRVTGGFLWAALPPASRGAQPRPTLPVSAMAALVTIERRATADPTPANLGALAAATIVQGDAARAIDMLEQAVTNSTKAPELFSDLSAAYLVRDAPSDPNAALAAAERARRLNARLPEALFNRALALESLSLTDAAIVAWRDYLALDERSPWAAEARDHLARLASPARGRTWDDEKQALVRDGPSAVSDALVARFAQECRQWLED
jgi:tetratricopeptide (TPR) repeat protein